MAEGLTTSDAGAPAPGVTAPRLAVVVGGGGIGTALVGGLRAGGWEVVHWTRRSDPAIDVTDETGIAAAAARLPRPPELVLVTTGILHGDGVAPEKSWRMIEAAAFARVLAINTIGPALVAKHLLPLLPRRGRAVFAALSARVGSIGDNRLGGWHAYRASKAALNQLIRCFAIELTTRNPDALCVGLHPGTVDTALSAPFQRGVAALFTPEDSASRLLTVLDALTPADSGGCFDHTGARIPA